jgi:glycosyltransferase involved in cell wall biosynthesis
MAENNLFPLISIITVVYNDKLGLQKTIKSVSKLNYQNIEYIIIDGDSNDGTQEVIKENLSIIDYWVSEKDKGIYHAMNKGIKASNGDWLNFMNAGDFFVNGNILNKIDFLKNLNTDILYGYKRIGNQFYYPINIKNLEIGEMFGNHQSMFFNKIKLMDELYYNENYKIYADYELVNRIYRRPNSILENIDLPVADYALGGVSGKISSQKRTEKYKIVYKSYGFFGLFRGVIYRFLKRNLLTFF